MSRLTSYLVEAYMAVPAARQDQANTFFKNNIDLDGGENTFRAGLSADGSSPATWYWCHGVFTLAQLKKIKTVVDSLPDSDVRLVLVKAAHGTKADILAEMAHDPPKVRVLDASWTPAQMLSAVGMQVVQEAEE